MNLLTIEVVWMVVVEEVVMKPWPLPDIPAS